MVGFRTTNPLINPFFNDAMAGSLPANSSGTPIVHSGTGPQSGTQAVSSGTAPTSGTSDHNAVATGLSQTHPGGEPDLEFQPKPTGSDANSTNTSDLSLSALLESRLSSQYQELSSKQKGSIKLAEKLLMQTAGESFKALSSEQKLELLNVLINLDLPANELMQAQVQGAGGKSFGFGVTGTGQEGHYVSSMMNSLGELIRNNRLNTNTLQALNQMIKAPLQSDLQTQRKELIQSTLQNIAFPEKIDQHGKGTCAATVPEKRLAIEDPARYIQIISALSSPDGTVPDTCIPGGNSPPIKREEGTEKPDESGRSVASRLIQPAFMEYANSELDYTNQTDKHSDNTSGLNGGQIVRLNNGLFGSGKYIELSPDTPEAKDECWARVEQSLQNGEAVSLGVFWGTGSHAILLTKTDPLNNTAYFMNPWGELHTLPLDQLKERTHRAVLLASPPVSSSPSADAAISKLPGAANNPANYRPSDEAYGQVPTRVLETVPELAQPLSQTQKESLLSLLDQHDVPVENLDRLIQIARKGHLDQPLIDRLKTSDNKDDFLKTLYLYERASLADITPEAFQKLVSAYPEKHLSTLKFDALLDALSTGDSPQIESLTQEAQQKMLQAASGQTDPGQLSQDQIKERFTQLDSGWTSEGSYQKLEQLAAAADADTKAWMIKKLMNGLTTGRSEQAISTILANANRSDQQAILSTLDLKGLGSEMERPDQAAEILNTITKVGFAPDLLESSLNQFFAGVTDQNINLGFIYRNNKDTQAAAAFIRKLDDQTLNRLPGSVKSKLMEAMLRDDGSLVRRALSANPFGTVGSQLDPKDERSTFPRLVKVMSPAQLEHFQQKLAKGYTNGHDEGKMLAIMVHATSDQFKSLVAQKGMLERLADELDADDLARVAYRLGHTGDHANLGRLIDIMDREHNSSSDDFSKHFVRLNSRPELNQLPQPILKKLYREMDEGWTTDSEDQMMERLKKAKNW